MLSEDLLDLKRPLLPGAAPDKIPFLETSIPSAMLYVGFCLQHDSLYLAIFLTLSYLPSPRVLTTTIHQ